MNFLRLVSFIFLFAALLFSSDTTGAFMRLLKSSSINVEIQGIDDSAIIDEFNAHSKLEKYKDKKIASTRWFEKLVADDRQTLLKILQSHGRYNANCTADHETVEDRTSVKFVVTNAEQFTYRHIKVNYESNEMYPLSLRENLGKNLNELNDKNVDASELYKSFSIFKEKASELGFPFAKVSDHCLTVVENTQTADLEITVSLGKRVSFGKVEVSGSPSIPHSYIRNRAPWCKGGMFQRSKLNEYQDILYRTELFDRVSIAANEDQIEGNKIHIKVDTKESKQKTIYASGDYSLSDGVGAKVGWEHRNLTGQADKLSPSLRMSQREQKAALSYTLPDFWKVDTSLKTSLEVRQADTKAYEDRGVYGLFSFETRYDDNITYFYGVSGEGSKIKKSGREQDNTIFGTPVGVIFSNVDDLLNPKTGFKFSAVATPEIGVIESDQVLARVVINASHYLPITEETTWANRVRTGTVLGVSDRVIPADRRFYAGGGGSVRAYGYQLAGPLDASNKPRGGRTVFDASTEIRQRLFDDWGAVAFIDGAYVEPKNIPNFNKDIFYGVGVGVRYYTDFGPIRLDVAVPLKENKDSFGKDINRPFQVYVSIGQSF